MARSPKTTTTDDTATASIQADVEVHQAQPAKRSPRAGSKLAQVPILVGEDISHQVGELAERERIVPSYMTRILRLTLLKPDLVEAILEGQQGAATTLAKLMEPPPAAWKDQSSLLNCCLDEPECRNRPKPVIQSRTRSVMHRSIPSVRPE